MQRHGVFILSAALTLACSGRSVKNPPTSVTLSDNLFAWDRPVLIPSSLPITKSATCRFKEGLAASFQKIPTPQNQDPPERIYYSESKEDEANTVSFVDLDSRTPKVQSNGGQATVIVVNDSEESITMLNHPGETRATELYTVFKKKGVVIYSQQKSSDFVGPFGILEMGYCN